MELREPHAAPHRAHTAGPRREIDLRGAALARLKPSVTSTKICLTSPPRKVRLCSAADSGAGEAAQLLRGWAAVSACPATKGPLPSVPQQPS